MKVSILFEVNYKIFTTYCDVENIIRICLFEDTVISWAMVCLCLLFIYIATFMFCLS